MTRIYVVRHAKAGNRQRWVGPDEVRPLTRAGIAQADALPAVFGDERFARLLSSPSTRCVQTLEPLAHAQNLDVEHAAELAEGAGGLAALELARSLAGGDGPAALCTHGDVLSELVTELGRHGVPLDGPDEAKKGSTWLLDVDRDGVRRGRYFEPPAARR